MTQRREACCGTISLYRQIVFCQGRHSSAGDCNGCVTVSGSALRIFRQLLIAVSVVTRSTGDIQVAEILTADWSILGSWPSPIRCARQTKQMQKPMGGAERLHGLARSATCHRFDSTPSVFYMRKHLSAALAGKETKFCEGVWTVTSLSCDNNIIVLFLVSMKQADVEHKNIVTLNLRRKPGPGYQGLSQKDASKRDVKDVQVLVKSILISRYHDRTHEAEIIDHSRIQHWRYVSAQYLGNLEERARQRDSRMGASSDGEGITSPFSSGGLGESLGTNINNLPRRRGSMDEGGRQRYYDSYWNRPYSSNQRTWSTEEDHQQRSLRAGYDCLAVLSSLAISMSIWLLFGLYGNQQLEMGMSYSRVVKANGFFVKQIQVRNLKERGPSMYSFSTRPVLDSPVSDKQEMEDVVIDPRWQKRFTYWLNKGSYLELSCCLKDSDSGTDSLIVAIVKGENGFQDWKENPDNPSFALRWKRIHDKGSLSLKVEDDNDYSVVFGNLNSHKITLSFKLELRYVLHSKESADLACSSEVTDTCAFPAALGQYTYILLTSPLVNLHKVAVWHSELSYVPRWTTYILLWGLVAAGFLITRACQLRQATTQNSTPQEYAPMLPEDDSQSAHSGTAYPVDETDKNKKGRIPPTQICSICLDAPKDSFFDPCGHRCTCYACGMRIRREDSSRCPICRQTIRTVRRIYDT